jgi:hypothetical protein
MAIIFLMDCAVDLTVVGVVDIDMRLPVFITGIGDGADVGVGVGVGVGIDADIGVDIGMDPVVVLLGLLLIIVVVMGADVIAEQHIISRLDE